MSKQQPQIEPPYDVRKVRIQTDPIEEPEAGADGERGVIHHEPGPDVPPQGPDNGKK